MTVWKRSAGALVDCHESNALGVGNAGQQGLVLIQDQPLSMGEAGTVFQIESSRAA
jgi:hypothetical protein